MSGPPRRPPGPPPARPPVDALEASGVKRPPGPPPGIPPIASIKPPPNSPPPDSLAQTVQRPGIEPSIKRPSGPPPDSSPKRPLEPPPDVAQPKKQATGNPPSAKAGAISMFEGPDKQPEPPAAAPMAVRARIPPPRQPPPRMAPQGVSADPSMPLNRAARPPPPRTMPAGIPEGQPLPPNAKPEKESRPPPPTKPPPITPEGGRAPPKEDPDQVLANQKTVLPPTTEPPVKREKKPIEEVVLKRREREMPEMESSDEDEEGPTLVKQPLPFGVIKQELPGAKDALDAADKASAATMKSSAAAAKPTPPTASAASVNTKSSDPPAVAPNERVDANELVPAAPPMDKHFDDSALGRFLSRGRLVLKCVEGIDIRRKDDPDRNPRNDPYIRFRLGAAERHPWKSTEVRRKQGSNPNFENEIVSFDILDPVQFIFQEDVQLCIELWNKSATKNELVGSITMSVVRFLKQPFVAYTEKVPIYYPGATRSSMKVVLEIVFEEARSGIAQITVFEASGLRNIDPMGRQDPFVQLSLGRHYKKRTKCVKGGGTDPYFDEEQVLMWLDQDNWVEDLQVDVLDEDTKEEKPIGSTHFSLLPYMKTLPQNAREDNYDLFYWVQTDPKDDSEKELVATGRILLRIRFLPAGALTVTVAQARGLLLPETLASAGRERLDPYVQLTLDGAAVQIVKRSPADKDGGADPSWNHDIRFDVVDQFTMAVQVMNQSFVGNEVLIGFAELSLLPAFRNGRSESWTTLKQKRPNGGVREVGDIFLRLAFTGPPGIAYPQLREEVDQFDETLRKGPQQPGAAAAAAAATHAGDEDEVKAEVKAVISTIPEDDAVPLEQALKAVAEAQESGAPPEFTDEEVVAAFKFIDLDRNNYVGAAEIRHILVCMGEMITDEEIDMMISMVDLDGDGQVSFKEFRTLVLHPNPAVVDMHKEINREKDGEVMRDKQAMAGKSQGLDLASFQRQKEMLAREEKKTMILNFIADNDVDFQFIKTAHADYADLPKERRAGGRVRFPDFCAVMRVEPITEYKNLHTFYDDEETGTMDLREFLLSLMNYVAVDRDDRVKFSFEMFDEGKTGFISQREVQEILRGNHILSLSSVLRKAETVMKQAHSDRAGAINLREFLVVSKKFPNILFPTAGVSNVPKGVRAAASSAVAIPG